MGERQRAAIATLALICLAAAGMARVLHGSVRDETCTDYELLTDPARLDIETSHVQLSGFPRQRSMNGLVVSPPPLPSLGFTIRRTYGLPTWMFRPTIAIPGPKEPDDTETRTIEVDGQPLDVRFAYARHRFRERLAVYTFAYEGETTLSPFWLRVVEAPRAALFGARPMTFIGIAGDADTIDIPELEAQAIDFVTAAWRLYKETCNP